MAITMDWSTIELASAIICACLPTYGPVISRRSCCPSVRRHWPAESERSSQRVSEPSIREDRGQCFSPGEYTVMSDPQFFQLEAGCSGSRLFTENSKKAHELVETKRGEKIGHDTY